jgi:hypothetical protein
MKRKSARIVRLHYRLILKNKGKVIIDTHKQIKSKILDLVKLTQWDNGFISVGYGDDYFNESEHKTKESLLKALSSYTEKQLLDYVEETEESEE